MPNLVMFGLGVEKNVVKIETVVNVSDQTVMGAVCHNASSRIDAQGSRLGQVVGEADGVD
jgi:hypothetical protein